MNSIAMSPQFQENCIPSPDQPSSVFKKIEKPLNADCIPEAFKKEWEEYRHQFTRPLLNNLMADISYENQKEASANPISGNINKMSKKENKESRKIGEMREIVESTAEAFSGIFDIPPEILVHLVHRESNFNPKALNNTGRVSKGLMQVTPIVFEDMKVRYPQFRPFFEEFSQLDQETLEKFPPGARKAIGTLSGNSSPQEGKRAINTLFGHIDDPYVNMLIGTTYLSFLSKGGTKMAMKSEPKDQERMENLRNRILDIPLKKINAQRKHTGHQDMDKDSLAAFADSLRDSEKMGQFISLVRYNQ